MSLRRALLALLAMSACTAYAAPSKVRGYSNQSATFGTPNASTEGYLDLGGTSGFRVVVEAPGGSIVSACWLRAWVWSDVLKKWARSASADSSGNGLLDLEIKAADVGKTTPLAFQDLAPMAQRGRVFYATDGCTGGLTVVLEGVAQ